MEQIWSKFFLNKAIFNNSKLKPYRRRAAPPAPLGLHYQSTSLPFYFCDSFIKRMNQAPYQNKITKLETNLGLGNSVKRSGCSSIEAS